MKKITPTKAYELIANPENWTQGYYARDKRGNPTCPTSRYYARDKRGNPTGLIGTAACSWCLFGAIENIYYGDGTAQIKAHLTIKDYIIKKYPSFNGTNVEWNDDPKRTHKQVYKLLLACDI